MSPNVTLTPAEPIPDGSCVCHYDELDQRTKERFPQLTEAGDTTVSEPIADGLRKCDVIKYTSYYTVSMR